MLFALAGTVAAIIYINKGTQVPLGDSFYTRVMLTANLGLLLSLAATLFAESKGTKQWALRALAALLGCGLLFIFGRQLHIIDTVRFLLLSLAFHLLVAFAAFTAKGQLQGFWQFNKTLFLRFLTGGLYSGVLYLGLAAAIGASTFLFNLNIHDKTYGTLFACIAGVFNTSFFLAGVPADVAALESDDTYPKALKVFTQYVLIPLASVYVIILLAYEVKILIQWNLPKGLVSNLILGYAVFGILSILLVYPLRNREENKWIKTYSRSFYFLLIPLIILLFLAIASRIVPYGITEMRYFLIVLALWLVFITAYFLLSRKQNIKVIPISLCLVALLSVYGPQSAFSVSGYSQRHMLINIFKKYGAVKNGKLIPLNKINISNKDGQDALERLHYFINNNELAALQPYIQKDFRVLTDSLQKARQIKLSGDYQGQAYFKDYEIQRLQMVWISKYLGLAKFNSRYNDNEITVTYNFGVLNQDLLVAKGCDYILNFGGYSRSSDADSVYHLKVDNIRILQKADSKQIYTLYLNYDKISFNAKNIADNLLARTNELKKYRDASSATAFRRYILPDSLLSFTQQTAHFKVIVKIKNLRLSNTDGYDMYINDVEGSYLITILK